MTSIAESHSPKHQPSPQRSPNPSSGINGKKRISTEGSSGAPSNVSTGSTSGSRYTIYDYIKS